MMPPMVVDAIRCYQKQMWLVTMIDALDYQLIDAVQLGLPLCSRPYAEIAAQTGLAEQEVIDRLRQLRSLGVIRRWGVVVNHRRLGYQANAMIVFDIPDAMLADTGGKISQYGFVNLCYQRPRQGQEWPYNLYCMIHGKSRETVLQQAEELVEGCSLSGYPREVLFSRRCFKQRGAIYGRYDLPVKAVAHG